MLHLAENPVLGVAAACPSFASFALEAVVGAIPYEPTCVDGVLQDRADRGFGPLAPDVAGRVGVDRRWDAFGVQAVGDRHRAEAVVAPPAIDPLDDWHLLGVGCEPALPVAFGGTSWDGVRLVFEAVAVRRASAAPVAILDVLRLASSGFDFDLVALVLIDGLFDRDLKLRAAAALVDDRHAEASQVSFEQGRIHSIAREPAGAVHDDLIEATRGRIARLRNEFEQARPLVMAPALHVEPFGRDRATERLDLALARVQLGWTGERYILPIVSAQSSVEREAHLVTPSLATSHGGSSSARSAANC